MVFCRFVVVLLLDCLAVGLPLAARGCCLVIMTVCVTLQPTRIQFYCTSAAATKRSLHLYEPGSWDFGFGQGFFKCRFLWSFIFLSPSPDCGANLIQLCTHLIVIFMRVYSWMCLAFYVVHRSPDLLYIWPAVGDPHNLLF